MQDNTNSPNDRKGYIITGPTSGISAGELLGAIARLSMSEVDDPAQAQRMVALLADGLHRRDAR